MENIELQTENNNVEFLRRYFFNLKGELNEIRNHIQTDEEAKTFFERKMREIINFHKVKHSGDIMDAVIMKPNKKEEQNV